jgi:hypothetical protein
MMKDNISKCQKNLIFFVLMLFLLSGLCVIGHQTSSIVLFGMTNNEEDVEIAFNYTSNRLIMLPDGSMSSQLPNGWRVANDDTGVLSYIDGKSHIQLLSLNLSETATLDSVIKQLEFSNQPGGRVIHSIISEKSITIDGTEGKRIEITGSDGTGQHLHGLVTVLLENRKCYVVSCITKESDFESLKNTFFELNNHLVLN